MRAVDFIQQVLEKDIARTNKFDVTVFPAPIMADYASADRLKLTCIGTQIGGDSLNTIKVRGLGKPDTFAISSNPASDLSLQFVISGDYFEYFYFKEWMDRITNVNQALSYPSEYFGSITSSGLDRRDNVILTEESIQVFPKSITKLMYSGSDKNTFLLFSVQFAKKGV